MGCRLILAVHVTDTITLGAAIIAGVLGASAILRALWVAPTKVDNAKLKMEVDNLGRQLRECREEINDKARRLQELGGEKDQYQQAIAGLTAELETVKRLPRYDDVVKLNQETLRHVDQAAAQRQQDFLQTVSRQLEKHDANVAEIAAEQREISEAMLKALNKIANNGEHR